MNEDSPQTESEKPRFMLPDGCKDLIDALRLQQAAEQPEPYELPKPRAPLPTAITFHDLILVRDLAAQLHLDPPALVDLLSRLGIIVTSNTCLEFYTATAICEVYGVTPNHVA